MSRRFTTCGSMLVGLLFLKILVVEHILSIENSMSRPSENAILFHIDTPVSICYIKKTAIMVGGL